MNRVRVIGIGNPERGDDAAGRLVARRLAAVDPSLDVRELDGGAIALLDSLGDLDAAYLVDASHSGRPAGTVRRFDAHQRPLPADLLGWSTHGLGLPDALELARALDELPPCCIVFTIEGGAFELGMEVSAPVAAAVDSVVARLAAEARAATE